MPYDFLSIKVSVFVTYLVGGEVLHILEGSIPHGDQPQLLPVHWGRGSPTLLQSQSSPSYIIYYNIDIERLNLKFTTVYILSTWFLIFPNRFLIYCTTIGGLVTVNVNKGRSWELYTQGERDGYVTCKRGKCRKSAQFRGAEVDEVN